MLPTSIESAVWQVTLTFAIAWVGYIVPVMFAYLEVFTDGASISKNRRTALGGSLFWETIDEHIDE